MKIVITKENSLEILKKINDGQIKISEELESQLYSRNSIFARFPTKGEIKDAPELEGSVIYREIATPKSKIVGSHMFEKTEYDYQENTMPQAAFLSEYGILPEEKTKRIDIEDLSMMSSSYITEMKKIKFNSEIELKEGMIVDILVDEEVEKQDRLDAVKKNGESIKRIENPTQEEYKAALFAKEPYFQSYEKIENPTKEDKVQAVSLYPDYYKEMKSPPSEALKKFIEANGDNLRDIKREEIPHEDFLVLALENARPGTSSDIEKDILDRFHPSEETIEKMLVIDPYMLRHIKSPTEKMKEVSVFNHADAIRLIENPSDKIKEIASKRTAHIFELVKNPSRELIENSFKYTDSKEEYPFKRTGVEKKITSPNTDKEKTVFQMKNKSTGKVCGFMQSPDMGVSYSSNKEVDFPKEITLMYSGEGIPLHISDQSFPYGWGEMELIVSTEEQLKKAKNISYIANMNNNKERSTGLEKRISLTGDVYHKLKDLMTNGDVAIKPTSLEFVKTSKEPYLYLSDLDIKSIKGIDEILKLEEDFSEYGNRNEQNKEEIKSTLLSDEKGSHKENTMGKKLGL